MRLTYQWFLRTLKGAGVAAVEADSCWHKREDEFGNKLERYTADSGDKILVLPGLRPRSVVRQKRLTLGSEARPVAGSAGRTPRSRSRPRRRDSPDGRSFGHGLESPCRGRSAHPGSSSRGSDSRHRGASSPRERRRSRSLARGGFGTRSSSPPGIEASERSPPPRFLQRRVADASLSPFREDSQPEEQSVVPSRGRGKAVAQALSMSDLKKYEHCIRDAPANFDDADSSALYHMQSQCEKLIDGTFELNKVFN